MRGLRRRWWEPVACGVVCVGVLAWAVAGVPGLSQVPGWFYRPSHKAFGTLALAIPILVVAVSVGVFGAVLGRGGRLCAGLLVMVVAGGVGHIGIHLLSARGFDSTLEHTGAGHGQFLRVAAAQRDAPLETLRSYEAMADAGELREYAQSKPPGTLAVYFLIDAASRWDPLRVITTPICRAARAYPRTSDVSESAALGVLAFTVGTALTIVPLAFLAVALFGNRQLAVDAALLTLTSPSFALIGFHLDTALFPSVTLGATGLAAFGARRYDYRASIAGGALAALGVYLSFGLVAALGIALGATWIVALERRLAGDHRSALRTLRQSLMVLLGAALMLGCLCALLNFEPVEGYQRAVAYHEQWKAYVPTQLWRWLSLFEFFVHAGLPLGVMLMVEAVWCAAALMRGAPLSPPLFLGGMLLSLAVLAAHAGTNEVARLWWFMLPLLALALAASQRARPATSTERQRSMPRTLRVLCVGQLLIAFSLKMTLPW